jgi:hypothetical protein
MSPRRPDTLGYKVKLFAKYMEGGALETMLAAAQDPDYLNMQAELALNLQGIAQIIERNIDYETFAKCRSKVVELQEFLYSAPFEKTKSALTAKEKSDFPIVKMEGLAEELVRLFSNGKDQIKYQQELDTALTRRAKLIELDTKRVQFESNHMPAEQVLMLFSKVIESVRKCFKNDVAGLIAFGEDMDQLSGLASQGGNVALRGREGVSGMLAPRSEFSDEIRRELESEIAEHRDLDTEAYNERITELGEEYEEIEDQLSMYFLDPDLAKDDPDYIMAHEIIHTDEEDKDEMQNVARKMNQGTFRLKRRSNG